ncbi:radical SAM family heme chaperone HemW [Methylophaga sp. OBS1]|uniref:radical SAM family heme chaperone HemW n=1 Tax=Methylophaga sp. OBS1 TaxID=2991933 RepID=UPI002259D53E|nr:radical SAM family heme chaperone HemW [Methylophaga sp. OBS1]MCX4193038.1 radical SAM family heme chaperone HemW [Methylophaga sp. OBS1]
MFNFTALPPLSLYIHVPWCVRKCPYCDFNSHKSPQEIPEQAYVDALIRDLEQEVPLIWGRSVQSIFIGGGTPSLLSAEAYDRLFSAIRALLPLQHNAEITLEANPGTVEAGRFEAYRNIGINRLSIGIQSFDNEALKALGRIHDSQQAIAAVETARQAGFDNFNLDLMFGLPGQDEAKARHDVETAIALNPAHISYYQLTIEPNTLFYSQPPVLPEDDPIYDWQLANQARLAAAGYQQYETSAYARKGKQCRHNLNYWQFGDYIGIGAGAHGKISSASPQQIERRVKQKQPQTYLDTAGSDNCLLERSWVDEKEVGFEFMLNAMRLLDGVPTPLFQQHTGVPISLIKKPLAEAEQLGLIEHDIHRLRPTEKGQRYLNTLIEQFLGA